MGLRSPGRKIELASSRNGDRSDFKIFAAAGQPGRKGNVGFILATRRFRRHFQSIYYVQTPPTWYLRRRIYVLQEVARFPKVALSCSCNPFPNLEFQDKNELLRKTEINDTYVGHSLFVFSVTVVVALRFW